MENSNTIKAAKLLLIAIKNGEVTVYPNMDDTADYIQILEDAIFADGEQI